MTEKLIKVLQEAGIIVTADKKIKKSQVEAAVEFLVEAADDEASKSRKLNALLNEASEILSKYKNRLGPNGYDAPKIEGNRVDVSYRNHSLFTDRDGEEDDDSPDFTGGDKVAKILEEAFSKKPEYKFSFGADEKDWFSVYVTVKPEALEGGKSDQDLASSKFYYLKKNSSSLTKEQALYLEEKLKEVILPLSSDLKDLKVNIFNFSTSFSINVSGEYGWDSSCSKEGFSFYKNSNGAANGTVYYLGVPYKMGGKTLDQFIAKYKMAAKDFLKNKKKKYDYGMQMDQKYKSAPHYDLSGGRG